MPSPRFSPEALALIKAHPRPKRKRKTEKGLQRYDNHHDLRPRKNRFRFFDLPPELRNRILEYALVSPSGIRPILSAVSMHMGSLVLIRPTLNLPQNPFLKIFLLSKQFHAEAEPIAYGRNTFGFTSTDDISSFPHLATNPKTPARRRIRKRIRKIELTLDGSLSSATTNRIMNLITKPEALREIGIGSREQERMKRIFQSLSSLQSLTVHATLWPADELSYMVEPGHYGPVFFQQGKLPYSFDFKVLRVDSEEKIRLEVAEEVHDKVVPGYVAAVELNRNLGTGA